MKISLLVLKILVYRALIGFWLSRNYNFLSLNFITNQSWQVPCICHPVTYASFFSTCVSTVDYGSFSWFAAYFELEFGFKEVLAFIVSVGCGVWYMLQKVRSFSDQWRRT